jgi:signal peptidase I
MQENLPTAKAAKRSSEGGVVETIKIIFEALLIAIVIRTLLFQPFNIPSGSLIPTLLINDYIFVSKYSYGYSRHSFPFSPPLFEGRVLSSEPKRGDVAVFSNARQGGQDFIKRVIGLPGDKVQMIGGLLHINDRPVKKERMRDEATPDRSGRTTPVATYRETLPNGVAYTVIEVEGDHSFADNTPVYTVPPGHFFMMGDNRDNSTDSRDLSAVGYVPLENFVGRAEIVFFSLDPGASAWRVWEWPWTVRWDRMFMAIR